MFDLYRAIWRFSARRQIILILLSIAVAALAAAPLKFQQEIINHLTEPSADVPQLFWLAGGMMGVILFSLGLKWLLGFRSQLLGEDLIRRIRIILMERVTDPEERQGTVLTGTLSTAISAEAEELGKFAGSAFSEPVVQIGTLISVIAFVATAQPGLGILAVSILIPQVVIVLITQPQVNKLVAERVRLLRGASDRISAEMIDAVATGVLEDFDRIYDVRRVMFHWKTSTKFLLSALNGAGTVGILALGGYLVLQGRTDVGTVVAATMGLARLQAPTSFLIAFYRQVSANRVKYDMLVNIELRTT